jgi:hypothetical protein
VLSGCERRLGRCDLLNGCDHHCSLAHAVNNSRAVDTRPRRSAASSVATLAGEAANEFVDQHLGGNQALHQAAKDESAAAGSVQLLNSTVVRGRG